MADDERITGNLLKSPFRFHRHGQSGLPFSETLPHIARHADRIAIIRSMFTEHRNHEQALRLMHTGMTVVGRPTIGAWAAYGLGTVNQNLPAYIVLPDPGGLPIEGIRNCSTISGNTASYGGGGIYIDSESTLTLLSSIVAGNPAPSALDIFGVVSGASTNNLIGNAGMIGISNGSNGNIVGTSGSPINPHLGSLQNNGGPTNTMALLAGSPAIGAGGPLPHFRRLARCCRCCRPHHSSSWPAFSSCASSPRLYDWLLRSPLFGPFLRDWYQHRGIRPRVKSAP